MKTSSDMNNWEYFCCLLIIKRRANITPSTVGCRGYYLLHFVERIESFIDRRTNSTGMNNIFGPSKSAVI